MMRHTLDLSTARWRKSSHSNSNGGECVEIADNIPGVIPVRDSKNRARSALLVSARVCSDFVASLK